jgi:hypothetical protein
MTNSHLTPDFMTLPPQSERSQSVAKAQRYQGGLYAAQPGTGPIGQTCRTCKHIYRKEMGKTYLKCGLTRRWWTGGGGTDIKASAPACSKWEGA